MARFGNVSEHKEAAYTALGMSLVESSPAYAATLALTPNAFRSYYDVGQLTGAMTINLTVTECKKYDEIIFKFNADGTGRTVTPGTGFGANVGTSAVAANRNAVVTYIFDGTAFIKKSEELEA